jgi:hypothetical protein
MTPEGSETVGQQQFLRLLLLGPPKSRKTTISIGTAPGPVYVINSEDVEDLLPAKRLTRNFSHNTVHSSRAMEQALVVAAAQIKRGVKTIVWDTLSSFSDFLAEECLRASFTSAGLPDGRKAWPEYEKRLKNYVDRLKHLQAHVIVVSHFQDFSSESDSQASAGKKIPKVWSKSMADGIVPLLYGRARLSIAGKFPNVIYLDRDDRDAPIFITSMRGVWGPGCRNMGTLNGRPVEKLPADITKLIEHMKLVSD